ncbi:MAG: PH domain-containing protein [Planctomycetes bacterium]|nr:PH domain-containing protein [Planctomycetota bacterium]
MSNASEPPPAAAAPVLAHGHLHPAILLLRLVDALRQVVLPLVLGLVIDQLWFVVIAGGLFVLQLGYAVARYLTLEYTLTSEELRVREGLLERQERRIPLDRIQDLGFESTLLRRALGLAVVLVETASGRGVEARLDSLARADAEHLREVLLAARAARPVPAASADGLPPAAPTTAADELLPAGTTRAPVIAPASAAPLPEPEWIVHRSSGGELLQRGLTDLRLSAFVVTGFAALQFADQLGLLVRLRGAAGSFERWLASFSPLMTVLMLAGLVLATIAIGVVTTTLGNLVQFHGFTLLLRGDVLQRRYGLLTTRQKTLPRTRIQRVTIEQPWLRRLLGLGVIKADSAGTSRSEGQDVAAGWDVVVPLTRIHSAYALLPALLPGLEHCHFGWQNGSKKLIGRTAVQGLLLALVATAAAWQGLGPAALSAFGLVPLWAVLGVLIWRNLGYALDGDFLALRHGIVGRYTAFVPLPKVQAVVVQQSPLAQLLGLATLTVYVAGGSPTRLPDLTLADARSLAAAIASRAAQAAAADW